MEPTLLLMIQHGKMCMYRAAPSANVVAQAMHPVAQRGRNTPRSMKKVNDTVYVFDMGRNIAGVSGITLKGEAGTIVRLKHGERVMANGRVDQSNIDVHYRPTDILILFRPIFLY